MCAWASGNPIRESTPGSPRASFGQVADNPSWGAVRFAGAAGTILRHRALFGTLCRVSRVIFEETTSPAFPNYILVVARPGTSDLLRLVLCTKVGTGTFFRSTSQPLEGCRSRSRLPRPPSSTGGLRTFIATVRGSTDTSVDWTVKEPAGGSITQAGVYTAPQTPGTYTAMATSVADVRASQAARVRVVIPFGHIPGYDVGVDYHATDVDFEHTAFITEYQDPAVRQSVRTSSRAWPTARP